MDNWQNFNTLSEIISFINNNPQYKKFLSKQISISIVEDGETTWSEDIQVRFSEDHGELIIEGSVETVKL